MEITVVDNDAIFDEKNLHVEEDHKEENAAHGGAAADGAACQYHVRDYLHQSGDPDE